MDNTTNSHYFVKGNSSSRKHQNTTTSNSKNREMKKEISKKISSSGLKKFGLPKKSQNASQSLMSDVTMTSRQNPAAPTEKLGKSTDQMNDFSLRKPSLDSSYRYSDGKPTKKNLNKTVGVNMDRTGSSKKLMENGSTPNQGKSTQLPISGDISQFKIPSNNKKKQSANHIFNSMPSEYEATAGKPPIAQNKTTEQVYTNTMNSDHSPKLPEHKRGLGSLITNPDTVVTPNIADGYQERQQSGIFDDHSMKYSNNDNYGRNSNNYQLRTPKLNGSNAIHAIKPPSHDNIPEISPNAIPQLDEAVVPNKIMSSNLPRSLFDKKPSFDPQHGGLKQSQSFHGQLSSRNKQDKIFLSSGASSIRKTNHLPDKMGKKKFEQILKQKYKSKFANSFVSNGSQMSYYLTEKQRYLDQGFLNTQRVVTPVNHGLYDKKEPQSHSKDRILNTTFQTKVYDNMTNRLTKMEQQSESEKSKVPIRLIALNQTSNENVLSTQKERIQTSVPNTIRKYGNQESSQVPKMKNSAALAVKKGDVSDVGSCISDIVPRSGLWQCRQLDAIRPSHQTKMAGFFASGMGVEASKSMQISRSQPKIRLRNTFIQSQMRQQSQGTMKFYLDEEANQQQGMSCTRSDYHLKLQQSGIKIIDTDKLPAFRLNSMQKLNCGNEFRPLFQAKKMVVDRMRQTSIDSVLHRSEATLPLGIPKPQGLKTFDQKFRDFSQNNEKDRDQIAAKKGKRITHDLNKSNVPIHNHERENIRQSTRGDATPNILQQRADKQQQQKQMNSDIFKTDQLAKQDESQKILKLYKQIMTFNKKQNEEKTRQAIIGVRAKTGNAKNSTSQELSQALQTPQNRFDTNKTPILMAPGSAKNDNIKQFGADSKSRQNSLNRNEFTAHLFSHKASGSAKHSVDAFKSQIQFF